MQIGSEMFYDELADSVRYFKETEGGQEKMCKLLEDYGESKRIDTLFDTVKKLMDSMKWTLEQTLNNMQVSDVDRALLLKRF